MIFYPPPPPNHKRSDSECVRFDALGSFNSWMRLITGILFGIALVGFAYPYITDSFADMARRAEATLMKGLAQ